MDLAQKVKQLREEHGWTQEELAKRMGYASKVSVNKIEMGRPISQKIIVRLAEALGTTPAYLMGWDEENPTGVPGEVSEKKRELIEIVQTLSDEQVDAILRLLKK